MNAAANVDMIDQLLAQYQQDDDLILPTDEDDDEALYKQVMEEENSKSKLEDDPDAEADQKFLQEAMNVLNDVKMTKQDGEGTAKNSE